MGVLCTVEDAPGGLQDQVVVLPSQTLEEPAEVNSRVNVDPLPVVQPVQTRVQYVQPVRSRVVVPQVVAPQPVVTTLRRSINLAPAPVVTRPVVQSVVPQVVPAYGNVVVNPLA